MPETPPEVTAFSSNEAYAYSIPPATTVGHRAETWNVNNWLQEVKVKVTTKDEDAWIRLEDPKSGNLFAECPIPTEVPLITAVEPVIDSSRYFVLKIVDRDTHQHAFIGLGFRQREQASDFATVLHDHLRYVKKKRQAVVLKSEYEEKLAARQQDDEAVEMTSVSDMSLPPGETMTLNVPKPSKTSGSSWTPKSKISKAFSLLMDGQGNIVAGLSPRAALDRPASSEGTSAGEEGEPLSGVEPAPPGGPRPAILMPRLSGSVVHQTRPREDEWGDFIQP